MIRLTKDTDYVATLTLDMAGRLDNLLNHEIVDAFRPVLAHLQAEKARGALRGVIVRSAKRDFLSGGELEYLRRSEGPAEVFALTQRLKSLLRDLEHPGVPVVAALDGSALGIGFEFALACHYRVAVDSPKIHFGLPEINLGLMPGAGACIRLTWMLGVERAYPLLTSGHRYSPFEALSRGLVDEVVTDADTMLERARAYILSTPHGARAWDRGEPIPGGTAHDPEVAGYVVQQAAALARDHKLRFPAYRAVLSTLAEGSKVDFDTALRIETRHYTRLLAEPSAHNMINAFWFERKELTRGANRPRGFGKFRVRTVGVIGAGQMGIGIAYACARAGIRVVVKDVSRAVALKGKQLAERLVAEERGAGVLQLHESTELLARISFTERADDFEACDLVIEAVFENENVKRKVIREAAERIDEYALLASNTLSIPIARLADSSLRPEQFVGLHFFPPANHVPLVEIVRGPKTTKETVARAYDFVRAIKKLPILVKDDWGFYVARVQNTYILEGVTMLQDGYPAALIENLGRQLGMPAGPLELADRLSLPIVLGYERQAAEHYGEKYEAHPAARVLDELIAQDRTGRYAKRGFYDYDGDAAAPRLWGGLAEALGAGEASPPVSGGVGGDPFDRTLLERRLLFAQVIEAGWCLQEKVLTLVSEANLGSIHGWGFPAYTGGVIQYARQYRDGDFIDDAKALKAQFGPRFAVPKIMRRILNRRSILTSA